VLDALVKPAQSPLAPNAAMPADRRATQAPADVNQSVIDSLLDSDEHGKKGSNG
jgi:hypothetical protein